MARTKRGLPGDIAEHLNALEKEQKQQQRESLGTVAIMGGKQISIEELVGSDLRPDNLYQNSDFTDIEKHLAHPNPDCKYAWKVWDRKNGLKSDGYRSDSLHYGIRSGKYRPVSVDELKDGHDLPISTVELFSDAAAGDVSAIVLKGLVLVEVQPQAVREEYRQRELVAAMRANPRLGENLMRSKLQEQFGDKAEQVTIKTETPEDR